MSRQKISSIIQWFFGIIFILAGLGSFGNSVPYAISILLFGISLLPVVWKLLRKKKYLNKWIQVVVSVALFVVCMITVPSSNDRQEAESTEPIIETAVSVTTTPEVVYEEIVSTQTPTPTVTETPTPDRKSVV